MFENDFESNSIYVKIIVPSVFIISILFLAAWWQRNTRTWQMGLKIPGPAPLPFFGNALMFLTTNKTGEL